MFKEVMNDLWLARISSLSNEVGLYVVLLEVLLFMPNSLKHIGFKHQRESKQNSGNMFTFISKFAMLLYLSDVPLSFANHIGGVMASMW
jgi:hypothetical protein